MNRYRITTPRGASGTSDLNQAAVDAYRARGWHVARIGPSSVRIVPDPITSHLASVLPADQPCVECGAPVRAAWDDYCAACAQVSP